MNNEEHITLNEQEFSQAVEELDEDFLTGVQGGTGGTKRPLFDLNVPLPPESASEPAPKRLKIRIKGPSRPLGQPDSPTFKDLPEITKLPDLKSPKKIWE